VSGIGWRVSLDGGTPIAVSAAPEQTAELVSRQVIPVSAIAGPHLGGIAR